MAFRFKLIDEDGTDLGAFATSEPDWLPGHRIHRGPGDSLEVVRVVPAEDGNDVNGYLVVRAAAAGLTRPGGHAVCLERVFVNQVQAQLGGTERTGVVLCGAALWILSTSSLFARCFPLTARTHTAR